MLFSKTIHTWILFIVLEFQSTGGHKDYQLETTDSEDVQKDEISGNDVYVSTSLGKLRGKRRSGSIGNDVGADVFPLVDCYLGVPYAIPPTTKLRFQKTKPVQPWAGTRDASKFQATCPQRFGNPFENEDCLYLNIYTPVKPENSSLSPVMMYIHGGSYLAGSGNDFIGDTLAQLGVVVVTVNYRLGILGFLSSRTAALKGNWGLFDQVEALKWIQKNIKSFGGDANRVTIFGNSAGAASVGILAASPATKGLIQRAIMQSGSPYSFWAAHSNLSVDYENYVKNLAQKIGCKRSSLDEVVECLRFVDVEKLDIRLLQGDGLETLKPTKHDLLPIVDDEIIPANFFQTPVKLHVDSFMSGVAANEWSRHISLYFDLHAEEFGLAAAAIENLCCDMRMFEENVKYVMEKLHACGEMTSDLVVYRYTNFSALKDKEEIRQQYLNFGADVAFVVPSVKYAREVVEGGVPTYFYVFHHKKASIHYKSWQQNYHEIELLYVFGFPFRGDERAYSRSESSNYTPEDKEVSLHIMKLWTNFAKTGDPNGRPAEGSGAWETFEGSKLNYYLIDRPNNSSMKSNLRSEYVIFWNDIIPQLNLQQQKLTTTTKSSCLNVVVVSIVACIFCVLLLGGLIFLIIRQFKHFRPSDQKSEPAVILKPHSPN